MFKRGNDAVGGAALHEFGLLCRGEFALDHCIEKARALFCATGEPDYCLTLSNDRRRAINQETNARLKPEGATFLATEDGPAWVFPGQKLIGCRNDHNVLAVGTLSRNLEINFI